MQVALRYTQEFFDRLNAQRAHPPGALAPELRTLYMVPDVHLQGVGMTEN